MVRSRSVGVNVQGVSWPWHWVRAVWPPVSHPRKSDVLLGVAVRVTEVPWSKLMQLAPHVRKPAGDDVTVPSPLPPNCCFEMVTARMVLNVADTPRATSIVTVHVDVPEHPPPVHPAKR